MKLRVVEEDGFYSVYIEEIHLASFDTFPEVVRYFNEVQCVFEENT